MANNRRNQGSLLGDLQGIGRQFGILANKGFASVYKAGAYRFMDNQIMLITTFGRKTGQPYTTPIGYVEGSQFIYGMTRGGSEVSNWYKNVRKNPKVKLQIGSRTLNTTGETLEELEQIKKVLRLFLKYRPTYRRILGLSENPSEAELDRIANKWLAVRFKAEG